MTKQIRTTLLTALFFFGLMTSLQAQDKYEYAIVKQMAGDNEVLVSIGNLPLKKLEVSTNCNKDCGGLTTLIQEMSSEGWEVINATKNGFELYFFLKRKIKS